jgi:uncharacterized protein YifN (PemK superfamily)
VAEEVINSFEFFDKAIQEVSINHMDEVKTKSLQEFRNIHENQCISVAHYYSDIYKINKKTAVFLD